MTGGYAPTQVEREFVQFSWEPWVMRSARSPLLIPMSPRAGLLATCRKTYRCLGSAANQVMYDKYMSDVTASMCKDRVIENVSAVLNVRLDESSATWIVDLLCMGRLLRLKPIGLVYLNCSHDSIERDETRYSVVETTAEHRAMNGKELQRYQYIDEGGSARPFWIIDIHGSGMVITVVSDDFSLEWLDLAAHYPHLV